MIESLLGIHMLIWVNSGWFVVYIASLFVFLYKGVGDKAMRNVSIAMIIMLLIIYNPVTIRVLLTRMASEIEYSRLAWGILVVPVISYTVVMIFARRNLKKCVLPLLLLALLSTKTGTYAIKAENVYKVPNESIQVIDLIDSVSGDADYGEVEIVFPVTDPMSGEMTYDDSIYAGMKLYSTKYILVPITVDWIEISGYRLEYIVSRLEYDSIRIEKLGYSEIGKTEHYIVYKRNNDVGMET